MKINITINQSHVKALFYLLVYVVLGLFFITTVLSLFLPAYIDEISYPFVNGRFVYDGMVTNSALPQCQQNFRVPIPVTLWPGRYFAWVLQLPDSNLLLMRGKCIAIFMAWLSFVIYSLKKIYGLKGSLFELWGGIVALISIGLMPYYMVMNRPETLLVFCISFFLFSPSLYRGCQSRFQHALLYFVFLLVASFFFSAHIKALFYGVLVLASAIALPKRYPVLWRGLMLLLGLMAYQTIGYWSEKHLCPESKIVDKWLTDNGSQAHLLFESPMKFLEKIYNNWEFSTLYVRNFLFNYTHNWAQYLDGYPIEYAPSGLNPQINIGIIATLVIVTCTAAYTLIKEVRHIKQLKTHFILLFFLVAGIMSQALIQSIKSFYESAIVWPCIMLVLLSIAALIKQKGRLQYVCMGLILITAVVSQTRLIYISSRDLLKLPYIVQSDGQSYINDTLVHTPFNQLAVQHRVLSLASSCAISPNEHSLGIGVDKITYGPFKNTFQPVWVPRVFNFNEKSDNPESLARMLLSRGTTGIVASCKTLSPAFQKASTKDGGFCCISSEGLHALANDQKE